MWQITVMGLAHIPLVQDVKYVTVFTLYPKFHCIHLQCVWMVHLPKNYKVFTALIIWLVKLLHTVYIILIMQGGIFMTEKKKTLCYIFWPFGSFT